ncbi:hypothetical protein BFW94_22820 [Enterobacter ludwigii]|nr:hypothetical protein AM379_08060 [Enterobacter cloacae complex sp. FDA-CDC-AR_0132]AWC84150.1 hypothetical protein AM410_06800 [Enterobacter cloacae complex sp. FDA-CDC-AR_0164]OPB19895.1 hypothetical protein BFW94_22820 [Enterobacter ludwigii]RBO20886.1 hypothetical protein C2E44_17885 [Enterobacter ludwigii]
MYTPESILFPYFPRISARFRVENEQRTTQEDEHHAPGRGLYGLPNKAQGSSRIFVRSFKQEIVCAH